MADRALEGLRVVEFTDDLGSYCGRLLADLGADVVKVEPPGGGRERHTPPFYRAAAPGPDTSLAFWVHNTSKKSVVLDLEMADGQAEARALALTADVVVEDNAVGYMSAHGLGYESLRAEKPALVYTSITGFGQTGPHASYCYSDIVGQAMAGVMTLAGEPADPPNIIYGQQANVSASIQAAQATLLAVLHADATGEGQLVDVSAQEAQSMNQETAMQQWDLQKLNRKRTGEKGALPLTLPGLGVYPTTDGYVMCFVIAPAGAGFPELVNWMRKKGMAGDLDDEPYREICDNLNFGFFTQLARDPARAAAMIPHLGHINTLLIEFFASMSATEAYEAGQTRLLLQGIVSTPKDLAENAQLRARHWFKQLEFDYLNAIIEFPGPLYRLSETPVQIARPPRLGEHTSEVLAALAALSTGRTK